jgi:hypothetical protein
MSEVQREKSASMLEVRSPTQRDTTHIAFVSDLGGRCGGGCTMDTVEGTGYGIHIIRCMHME